MFVMAAFLEDDIFRRRSSYRVDDRAREYASENGMVRLSSARCWMKRRGDV
jgi:hypothetical protein